MAFASVNFLGLVVLLTLPVPAPLLAPPLVLPWLLGWRSIH
jgi:hypothetical protein